MAKIELVAKTPSKALDNTIHLYHSYILVTYDDGSQYYLRGGSHDDTPSGMLFGVYGEYVPGTVDYDVDGDDIASRILVEADDATIEALYQTMVARAEEINAGGYPYEAFVNGCNAFAGQLLIAIGIVDPLDPTRVDPTAVPTLGPDGPTVFLAAFFNPVPYPSDLSHFVTLLDAYQAWVDYNGIPYEIEQMLTFSEAWFATLNDTPALVLQARQELAHWLFRNYGLPVIVGNNSDNVGLGTSGAEIITGMKGNDTLNGLAGDDRLYGGSGNDALDGGAGADVMVGGSGNDTYLVDNAGDQVAEHAGEGIDLVNSSTSFALAADQEIENLTLTGSATIDGTGNEFNNTLTGNSANNVLDGGAGADTLAGGAGNDTYVVDSTGDIVVEAVAEGTDTVRSSVSYTLAAEVENLVLTGTAAIAGTGDALANVITGNGGANTISGGGGKDILNGGAGNDTLNGNSGADTLDGGAGADVMAGGAGNDTYLVDNAGDRVIERAGHGIDTIITTLDSRKLDADVEKLIYSGAEDFHGGGNGLSNHLYGGSGNDILNGGAGDDFLYGSAGDDHLKGGSGQNSFVFDTGLDPTTNVDTVFDFSSIDDQILMSGNVFAAAGSPGTLAASAFFVGAAAHDADDRITYDNATGALSYDRDGTGAEAASQFASLSPGLSLANTNMRIF